MRLVLACLMALCMVGCASVQTVPSVDSMPPTHLLQKCPDLPDAQSGAMDDLFRNHVEVRALYEHCRETLNQLQDYVKGKK